MIGWPGPAAATGSRGVAAAALPVLALPVVALLAGCSGATEAAAEQALASAEAVATSTSSGVAAPPDAQLATVVEVPAGDTLVVEAEPGVLLAEPGRAEVLLLQVDAPNPGEPAGEGDEGAAEECLAAEATAHTAGLLPPGSSVLLAPDAEPRDAEGRVVGYAWTEDGTFVNESLVRNGLGYVTLFPPNDEHIGVMTTAETAARDARLGVWGDC